MKRSEATRYARWSAAMALLLVAITVIVYLQRDWRGYLETKKAPPPAPVDVTQQSNALTFKKVDQNRTIFVVEASKSTEFKGDNARLLEHVKVTILGAAGARHDTLQTQSCRYGQKDGGIACSGDVMIDLLSAEDAARAAGNADELKARTVHVETKEVTFDRNTGIAKTQRPVSFVFPGGTGTATGLNYDANEGIVHLLSDVQMTLTQPLANIAGQKSTRVQSKPEQNVHVTGSALDFGRDTRLMHLQGPVQMNTRFQKLTAGDVSLALDSDFHAERLIAIVSSNNADRPTLTSQNSPREMKVDADKMTANFVAQGWLSSIDAVGSLHGFENAAGRKNDIRADSGTMDLWPKISQAKELKLNGNVSVKSVLDKNSSTRELQTSALQVEFSRPKNTESSEPVMAETLARGTMTWTDTVAGGTPRETKLQADELKLDFGSHAKPNHLEAIGNMRMDRSLFSANSVQSATARNGEAQLLDSGEWSQVVLRQDVKLSENDRTGQADNAVFQRLAETAVLTGHASVRDATTETHAPRITFEQTTGDIRAEGGVRSTDFSGKGGATIQLAPVPANITADTLQANSKTSRALYTGRARLWQGDSVLEANSLELLRSSRVLNAVGNVHGVFPQAPSTLEKGGPATGPAATARSASMANGGALPSARKPELWRVTAGTLTYLDAENRAHLEHDVVVQSKEQRMQAPRLDLFFSRSTDASQDPVKAGKTVETSQQITRAVGEGGVTVEQGDRRASAERGEYTASNGRFVMSGGNPTLFDGSEGTTTGRELTFFLADDTIIVGSEKGSRTLTKHKVEK